ncbi:hypothetical protein [Methylobacterium soli]|uniref:Uncharacterized protein n=2 Tax=Methylobacterium soli TaxID=553447 RepID=A0A6L3T676_9HYPH|nr:hypothetical protein [Methylobacterium soli]KAB1080634.1 hypothetical protein F6X53_05490 [Methylobacterium soli]
MAQCEAIRTYRQRLLDEGRGVPENPQRLGEICWWQVRRETGLPQSQVHSGQFARREIQALAREIGLTQVVGIDGISTFRFKELAINGRSQTLSKAPEDQSSNRKKLSNLRWALNRVIKSTGPDACARAAIETLLADLGDGSGSLRAELNWCLRLLTTYEAGQDLPESFASALRTALIKAGLSKKKAAKQVGMTFHTLVAWVGGRAAPRPFSMHLVARLEAACRLAPGTLASRVRFSGRGKGALPRELTLPPEFAPGTPLRRRLLRELPDDIMARGTAQRDALILGTCQRLLDEKGREHHVSHTIGSPYRLNVWPERLEREWGELARFKGEGALGRGTDRREGKLWRPGTLRILKSALSSILGFMTKPGSPYSVKAEDLTLTHLVFAGRFYNSYLTFRSDRNRTAKKLKQGYITTAEVSALWMIRSQLKPGTGWLAQRAELASRLTPVEGFVTQEDIAAVQADWAGACAGAHRDCRSLIKSYQRHVAPGRDSHEPVLPILSSPEPLAALHTLNRGMEQEGEAITGGIHAAMHLRDRVLVGVLSQFPLRPETLSLLDYTSDGRGHLRREGGGWKLRISRFLFKNPWSTYFRVGRTTWKDFEEDIQDLCGLHDAIARYVSQGRDIIRRDRHTGQLIGHTDALFVVRPRLDAERRPVRREREVVRLPNGELPPAADACRMCPDAIDNQVRAATGRHLAGRANAGTGIPDVRAFPPLDFRHIVATGVFKATDSWSAAADAIQDDVAMVRATYGRYDSSDRRGTIQNAYKRAYRLG